MDVQGCRLPARKTPQTLPCSSQAPLRPRQTFPAAPTSPLRPWQSPFKDVQGCRLPARKTRQTLPCSSQAPLRPRQTFPAAPTSPWGPGSIFLWTFKAAVCQPAKLAKTLPCSSQAPLRPRQTFPAAPTSPWGPGSVFLWTFKAAVCQPAKLAKPSPAAPRRHSGRGRPFLQLQQVPEALGSVLFKDVQGCRLPARKTRQTLPCSSQAPLRPRQTFPAALTSPCGRGSVFLWTFKAAVCQPSKRAKPSPAAPRRHSGRGRPFLQLQQVCEAVAASFYGRSRLPFASPQNSPNPPLQLPGATQAAADLSCSSNKSLRQCPFKDVQRLPFASPQNSPNPPLQLPGATQAAADLSCSSNKSLRPWQCPFKDVQGCSKPSPAAPRHHSGEALAVSF